MQKQRSNYSPLKTSDCAEFDVCIIGGGSAGIGAALSAARSDLSVVVVEKGDCLGGNAVRGGVHNWEPGVGGTAFPREIYDRLNRHPQNVGIWSMARHCCWPLQNTPPFPGGELKFDSTRTYRDTLKRHGTRGLISDQEKISEQWHGVIFEPEPYAQTVEDLLLETGNCVVWKNATFVSVRSQENRVTDIKIICEKQTSSIKAKFFIDATANAAVCQTAGCEVVMGEDAFQRHHEPDAPAEANPRTVNAVTLIYRITPLQLPKIESLPSTIPSKCWFQSNWPYAAIGQYPNGDRNVNMLPTMEGSEFLDFVDKGSDGYQRAFEECRRRLRGHWYFLQTEFPEFQSYRLSWIAPTLGVRESLRVIGEYVLTEHDLLAGLSRQEHQDIIAIADHALDTHGAGNSHCPELDQPYGVPLRCLIAKGWKNLMAVGRCSSFSHIAASSCRLSRTMMDLGHAAGLATALAIETKCDLSKINPLLLRKRLKDQGATLG